MGGGIFTCIANITEEERRGRLIKNNDKNDDKKRTKLGEKCLATRSESYLAKSRITSPALGAAFCSVSCSVSDIL